MGKLNFRNMNSKVFLSLFAITAAFLLGSCKKETFVRVDTVCPLVISTSPAAGEIGVPLTKMITATFNEPMNPATINAASFKLMGPSELNGTITFSGTTAQFVPTGGLRPHTTYVAMMTTLAKDTLGNALQEDYVWTFSTGDSLSPMVTATDPLNLESNVVLNQTLTAKFNMDMDPLTLAGAFSLKTGSTVVPGVAGYADSTGWFTPSSPLLPNAIYYATIASSASNAAGTQMEADYQWSFATGGLIAPIVISTNPNDEETNVPLTQNITAVFSDIMDPTTLDGTTFKVWQGTTPVNGTVSYTGNSALFVPATYLVSGETYTATITTGAKNLAGISLSNAYVWTFQTVPHLGPNDVPINSAGRFGIMAGVGISNNAGISEIHNMDVGISPGVRSSVTGFPPAIIVNGAIYASDDISPPGVSSMLIRAMQDLTDAYLFAESASSPAPATVSGDIGGMTLTPGIYKSTSTLMVQSGDLTLDAQGDENAVWIFQVASNLTTVGGAGGNIILIGGAQANNVYWQTGNSATVGGFTDFKGNILALTSITMNPGASATGRMLARNGSVVMTSTNTIYKP